MSPISEPWSPAWRTPCSREARKALRRARDPPTLAPAAPGSPRAPRARPRQLRRLAGTVAAELRRGRHRRGLRALAGGICRSNSGESGPMPPEQRDGHMRYAKAARLTDLDDAIEKLFEDLRLELVCCELCSDYHRPTSTCSRSRRTTPPSRRRRNRGAHRRDRGANPHPQALRRSRLQPDDAVWCPAYLRTAAGLSSAGRTPRGSRSSRSTRATPRSARRSARTASGRCTTSSPRDAGHPNQSRSPRGPVCTGSVLRSSSTTCHP